MLAFPFPPTSVGWTIHICKGRSPRHDRPSCGSFCWGGGSRGLMGVSSLLSSVRVPLETEAQIWAGGIIWEVPVTLLSGVGSEVEGIKAVRGTRKRKWSSKPQPSAWGWCLQPAYCPRAHRISAGQPRRRISIHRSREVILVIVEPPDQQCWEISQLMLYKWKVNFIVLSHEHLAPFVMAASPPWLVHSLSWDVLTAEVPQGILCLHSLPWGSYLWCYIPIPAGNSWTWISSPLFPEPRQVQPIAWLTTPPGCSWYLNSSCSDGLLFKSAPCRSAYVEGTFILPVHRPHINPLSFCWLYLQKC